MWKVGEERPQIDLDSTDGPGGMRSDPDAGDERGGRVEKEECAILDLNLALPIKEIGIPMGGRV